MDPLVEFYTAHPFWTWAAVGAALLAIEVSLGTEYLLWAAASAAVVAVLAALAPGVGLPVELGVFALLTMVSALVSWRFFPPRQPGDVDINDPNARIVGRRGHAVGPFARGEGRVFVDGKEWNAQADGDLADGDAVEVESLKDGASLQVRRL
jgi:membrane protein implicated in regulation of membrane protease activity